MANFIDYYEILEVHPKASTEVIEKSYKTLVKIYHPDTTSLPKEEAQNKFILINEAYEVLSNPEKRQKYDNSLLTNSSTSSSVETLKENEDIITEKCDQLYRKFDTSMQGENDPSRLISIAIDTYNEFQTDIYPLVENQIAMANEQDDALKNSFYSSACVLRNVGVLLSYYGAYEESNQALELTLQYTVFSPDLDNEVRTYLSENKKKTVAPSIQPQAVSANPTYNAPETHSNHSSDAFETLVSKKEPTNMWGFLSTCLGKFFLGIGFIIFVIFFGFGMLFSSCKSTPATTPQQNPPAQYQQQNQTQQEQPPKMIPPPSKNQEQPPKMIPPPSSKPKEEAPKMLPPPSSKPKQEAPKMLPPPSSKPKQEAPKMLPPPSKN